MNLFAACTVARISLDRIIRQLIPFVLVVVACLMVITYVPALSLTLRDLVYGRQAPAASAPAATMHMSGERSRAEPPKAQG